MPEGRVPSTVAGMSRAARLLLVLALIVPVALRAASFDVRAAYTVQVVEVNEGGFNPAVCKMNREYVQFKNVGTTPRRVIRPGVLATDPPLIDTGPIPPGGVSIEILVPHGGTTVFYDADNRSHSMQVITPVLVEYWDPICTADPSRRPAVPACLDVTRCRVLPMLASE
ncbi:MAG: hypothetical protein AB7P22_19805 [Vicinamibacterales bacterium]